MSLRKHHINNAAKVDPCHSVGLNLMRLHSIPSFKSAFFCLFVAPGGKCSSRGRVGRDGVGTSAEED